MHVRIIEEHIHRVILTDCFFHTDDFLACRATWSFISVTVTFSKLLCEILNMCHLATVHTFHPITT